MDGWGGVGKLFISMGWVQGRRRISKSGPVEDIVECRRHEKGESTRGDVPPLVRGVLGFSPRKFG